MSTAPMKVICHMTTSLDGKIDGELNQSPEINTYAYDHFVGIGAEKLYPLSPVTIMGRKSVDVLYTYADPSVIPTAAAGSIPRTDYWADLADKTAAAAFMKGGKRFMAVIDPRGVGVYRSNTMEINRGSDVEYDVGSDDLSGDRIIAILTEDTVSDGYLAYLQSIQVPYIFAGKSKLVCRTVLEKLRDHLRIDTILLYGGAAVNGSFMHEGLITDLSFILTPFISGSAADLAAVEPFGPDMKGKAGWAQFKLESVEKRAGDALWLRYSIASLSPK